MKLVNQLEQRLREGGWTVKRSGKGHSIWQHPNGAIFTLACSIRDAASKRANYLTKIAKLEQLGPSKGKP